MKHTITTLLLLITGCGTGMVEPELVVDPKQWNSFEVMTTDGERIVAGMQREPDYTRLLVFEPGEVAFFEGTTLDDFRVLRVFDPPLEGGERIDVFAGIRLQMFICLGTCDVAATEATRGYTLHTKPVAP